MIPTLEQFCRKVSRKPRASGDDPTYKNVARAWLK